MLAPHLRRNDADIGVINRLIAAGEDGPVLMLNQNTYSQEAGYPDGELYRAYIGGLEQLVARCGGTILWREPVLGQPVGEERRCDEILAIWYPSHRAYMDLPATEGGAENYRLRSLCVEAAHIYRCPGSRWAQA